MKRFRSFLLFSAVAALLAFAGSAWAADTNVISADLLSFDEAVDAAISFDISADKILTKSKDLFFVKLSVDAIASFDQISKITVTGSKDKDYSFEFSKNQSIDVFVVGSTDATPTKFEAFKLSPDTANKSNDVLIAFPVVLFEKASGDMKVTSSDKKISSVTLFQDYSADLKLKNIAESSDSVVIAYVSSDKSYKTWKTSADFPDASSTFVIVTNGNVTASKDFVEFTFSDDVEMGDLLITKFVTSSDTAKNVAYGVIYSGDVSADVISTDKIWFNPMPVLSNEPEVKVAVYNASKDAMLKAVTFKRYVMKASSFDVSFDLDGGTYSGDVSLKQKVEFASPDTWLVKEPASSDLSKSGYAFKFWADSADVSKSWDFTVIPTEAVTLKAVWSADANSTTGDTFTVTLSPDADFTLEVGGTKDITVTSPASADGYAWYYTSGDTKPTSSADCTAGATTATQTVTIPSTASSGDKYYYFVYVTSGSVTVSSDVRTVTVVSSTTTDTTVTLSSLAVTVSPDASEPWDVSADKADSIPLAMTVVGTFSDSSSNDVTSSTTNTWTLGSSVDTKIFSLSSTSGATTTIAIASTITSGEYSVPVTAKAVSGDVSKEETVTYTIVASGSGGGTPGSDAAIEEAKKAVTDAISGIDNPSIEDVLKSAEAVAAIGKAVSSTGELDMSVLDGVTSLKGLATLLNNLKTAGATVSTLDFASMGTSLTTISAGDLQGVSVTAMTFTGNKNITSVNFSGATVATVTLTNSAVKTLSLPSDANVATVNAQGASDLTTVEVAGNTNIKELDIGETSVASLDVKGCTSLTTLAVDNTNASGQGSLEELDITSCDSLTRLDVQRNKLLGIKKPSPSFAKPGFVFNAGGQRRAAPSGFTLSTSMNFWSILRSLLGLGNSGTIPFTVTTTTVTFNYGGTLNNETGEVTYTTTPTAFSYSYNPGFTTAGSSSVSTAADSTMDVQIGDSGSGSTTTEAKLGSSSGGGCDAGFGFGALAALMAVFALKKKR